jgi:methylenetetrahydrofolate dehydrogenase (NADP+)/methenyltetrahydrofolate cyclohydrolase
VPDETKEKGYVITGDVDFENVVKKQVYYSVPGGVGPMTIAMLLKHVGKRNENVEIRK